MKIRGNSIYNCLFILIFIFISECLPQGKIIGVVRDKNYQTPIKDAVVSLMLNDNGFKLSSQNTDGTGFFAFNDIPFGKYQIEVTFKGYSGYKIKNILLIDRKTDFIFDTIKISSKQTGNDEIVLKDESPVSQIEEEKYISLVNSSTGKIIGTVRDKKDFTPIKDAAVLLFRNDDSTKFAGTGTNGTGNFAFNNLEYGKYKIEISYIGYSVYKLKNIQISDVNPTINIDSIKLSASNFSTDEIVVQDEKPLMEFNDDKKVFNIDKILTSRGGTAIDVLKKLPMVEVDAQDNVSLRGSKNLLILIDNKPMKFASLRQLPSDAIKNVEIITNPSAKYEAEGVTGILNIVLKKNENTGIGYNGYLYTSYRENRSYNGGLGLNMKKRKWSFFLNGGIGEYRYKSNNSSDVTYYQPQSFYNSHSDGNGNSKYYYSGFGIEYDLIKNHSVGFDSYYSLSDFNSANNSISNNYNVYHTLSSLYSNNSSGNGNFDNIYASMYYNGKFGKIGKELNFDASFSRMNNKYNTSQNIQYYDSLSHPINKTPSIQLNPSADKNMNFRIQLDYTNPFNDNTKFETGYKGTFRSNDNDYAFDTLNYSRNSIVRNVDLTNHFKLSDNINAVY
ncbi:MAG: TonB-dependent receptor, partial [Ignavibacteria bacterium]